MRNRFRISAAALGILLASLLALTPTASASMRTVLLEMFTNTG